MEIAVEIIIALLTVAFVLYPLLLVRPAPKLDTDADIEAEVLKLRQRKNRLCPKCGSANPADARFCSECAAKLNKER